MSLGRVHFRHSPTSPSAISSCTLPLRELHLYSLRVYYKCSGVSDTSGYVSATPWGIAPSPFFPFPHIQLEGAGSPRCKPVMFRRPSSYKPRNRSFPIPPHPAVSFIFHIFFLFLPSFRLLPYPLQSGPKNPVRGQLSAQGCTVGFTMHWVQAMRGPKHTFVKFYLI